ncbi:uncharacterized protein FIBRA_03039 [Fibroporia radiculosa]|uniref:NADP-dependent oxidoreductase domain-containing protein n=1 Tax=Fibroporia radiculosa TaxID=599839 RepID=J4I9D9_9APHY|nr:uncharacterized protein FIBRA_03039 [Fibroporia radiculosa]CCM00991.1 predicted protein [Fibroporia radiculosa]
MPPAYKQLSTHDPEEVSVDPTSSPTSRLTSRLSFTAVARLIAVMVLAYAGVRFLTRAALKLRAPCHSGLQRNLSSLPTHYTLPSGDKIPSVALGVWQASRGEVGAAVTTALQAGYRHIDGAWIYRNEEEVGQAIRESGVSREELWITSKLWNTFHAPEDVESALDDSLKKLDTQYLDLYLMHWPVAFKKDTTEVDKELTANPYPTWQKLEELVEKGKVRNIGVSNFNIARIQNLTANPLKVQPAVNQVELSYWNPQPELLAWAKENGLLLEAYSPLGSNKQVKESLEAPAVQTIAKQLGITPAQVIISWHVQRGTIVLPKSVTPSRVEENYHIFALPEDLFEQLETAATSHPPLRVVNPSKSWGLGYDVFDDYPQ